MSAESLWDCHDVGNAIKIQIKKSHDECERIQWNREQCVFFKYYIDAYCSTYDTDFTSAQMRQICDIALPSKLWDIYEKVGSLISQSDNSKYEFVILKAETAGIFDAVNKGQNLYNYLVGKNISSKNPVQQEASPRRAGYKESTEFSTKSNRETIKNSIDSVGGSSPQNNNEDQFSEAEVTPSTPWGLAFVMLGLCASVGLFLYFSDKGYKYPTGLEPPPQAKLKLDSSSQPLGESGITDPIATKNRDLQSQKQEIGEILQKLDQDPYDLEIKRYELKITELLDGSLSKKAKYLDRNTDWATVDLRFTSDGQLFHYQLVDAFMWDQDVLYNVMSDLSLPKPPLYLREISVQVLLPLNERKSIKSEVAKEAVTNNQSNNPFERGSKTQIESSEPIEQKAVSEASKVNESVATRATPKTTDVVNPRVGVPKRQMPDAFNSKRERHKQVLGAFKSKLERLIDLEMDRKPYPGAQYVGDVKLVFSLTGNYMGYELSDPLDVDLEYFSEIMGAVALVIPTSPSSISELTVQVAIPFKTTNETINKQVRRSDAVTIDEIEINEVKPRPEVEYLEKPTHFDFKITDIGELIFDEEQGLQVTVDTNWSDYFSAPIISIAPVELYYVHSVTHNEEFIRDLDVSFNEANGAIILKNTNNLDAGAYTVLLEIINGRSEINYQTVSFKLNKKLNLRKNMQQWKDRLESLRD